MVVDVVLVLATNQLIKELQRRFPEHVVLDVLGIIYP
jgi:hypothetical protein